MSPSLLQAPKPLKEYINKYQENKKLLEVKEKTIKEPTFNTFLSSYVVDVIMFVTGILTVILTFVIMYILFRQSKLNSMVVNMALQHIKTIEAAVIKETESCNFELMQLLIFLNLVMAALLIFIKLKYFKDIYLQTW